MSLNVPLLNLPLPPGVRVPLVGKHRAMRLITGGGGGKVLTTVGTVRYCSYNFVLSTYSPFIDHGHHYRQPWLVSMLCSRVEV
jgi:hypothetical protein